MKPLESLARLFLRLRYPMSLPEDIAFSLGIHISNSISFKDFVSCLTCPQARPTRLKKFMPRKLAEEAFKRAPRKECFQNNSHFSFCFNEGWVEFVLQFDDQSRLRRIYLHHRDIANDRGIEIPLSPSTESSPCTASVINRLLA